MHENTPEAEAIFHEAARLCAEGGGTSFLVLIGGDIAYEKYRRTGRVNRANPLASGTKSFAGVLALCAQDDGILNLDDELGPLVPEWQDDPVRASLTLRQILTLTSGLSPGQGGSVPSYRQAMQADLIQLPGMGFHYGPAAFQVFGEILHRSLQAEGISVSEYMRKRVLDPLGIQPAFWRTDADGQPHLPSGASLTARDWAKLGEMIRSGGQGILSPDDVRILFSGTEANPAYGLTWWLPSNGPVGGQFRREISREDLPPDILMAAGLGGQRLVVIPSLELVAVRQAPVRWRSSVFREAAWLRALVQAAGGWHQKADVSRRQSGSFELPVPVADSAGPVP